MSRATLGLQRGGRPSRTISLFQIHNRRGRHDAGYQNAWSGNLTGGQVSAPAVQGVNLSENAARASLAQTKCIWPMPSCCHRPYKWPCSRQPHAALRAATPAASSKLCGGRMLHTGHAHGSRAISARTASGAAGTPSLFMQRRSSLRFCARRPWQTAPAAAAGSR